MTLIILILIWSQSFSHSLPTPSPYIGKLNRNLHKQASTALQQLYVNSFTNYAISMISPDSLLFLYFYSSSIIKLVIYASAWSPSWYSFVVVSYCCYWDVIYECLIINSVLLNRKQLAVSITSTLSALNMFDVYSVIFKTGSRSDCLSFNLN